MINEAKPMQMIIGDHCMSYMLRRSARKTIEIRISPAGEVRVSAPYYTQLSDIEAFLGTKQAWIQEKRKVLARAQVLSADNAELSTGDMLRYKSGLLRLVVYQMADRPRVEARGGELCVWTADTGREAVRKLLMAWYMRAALCEVERLMPDCVRRVGLAPSHVTVRDMKTRWGSCSSKGRISINWKLIMAPQSVMCYVIIHELCHLSELNHSPAYWALVERAWPTYAEDKRWLRQNGSGLGL